MVIQTREIFEKQLMDRDSLVLSDGTRLDQLVDLRRREVKNRVFNDPELHLKELERIWAQCWIPICHETDLPDAGDFKRGYIGEDHVLLTRANDGSVNLFLNVCSHRSMEVCWSDEGNASTFKCPYHGWLFDGRGRLLGAPFEKQMYGEWDRSEYGLRLARVATRHGLIFGNFDDEAPSFEDYLGEAAWYHDAMYAGVEWETLGPPNRLTFDANWKTMVDQFAGDGYHGSTLHAALSELGMGDNNGIVNNFVKVSFPGLGHALLAFAPNRTDDTGHNSMLEEESPNSFAGRMLATLIFPNSNNFGGGPTMTGTDGSELRIAMMGAVVPRGPGRLQMWNTLLVSKDMPEETRSMLRKVNVIQSIGAAPDDAVAGASMQRAAVGAVGQEQTLKYNAIRGYAKPKGWPGPGFVCGGFPRDDSHWHFWQRWFERLTDEQ